ncbi:MAG: hypothetical protein HGA39_03105 [Coriobacteriia bacterium]|nr:hypothetical protein [Coriobacteriia bacterium]
MAEEKDLKEQSKEELIALYEKYSRTPSNPVSSILAAKVKSELESRGETLK